jgi:heavy metal translocating P-type ATPase
MTLAAFSSILIGSGFEGALLLVLFSASETMEEAVTAKARSALSELRKIAPTKALVIQDDRHYLEKSVSDISVGQKILIRAGEVVPLDGKVIEGISSVNLVHLTGEAVPITKSVGDEVAAGAKNMEGVLTLEVIHSSSESTITKIIDLVTEAQEARPTLQRWFDKLSRSYALSIISASALFAISFPFLFHLPFLGIEGSLYRALAFLIAASPCALILAIPIAYLSAIGICAKRGILIKGGVTLDALALCNAIAFDKTGTLTTGELSCLGFEEISNKHSLTDSEVIALATALERAAVHPIARAIIAYGKSQDIAPAFANNVRVVAGHGVEATYENDGISIPVFIGRIEYILDTVAANIKNVVQSKVKEKQESGELLALLQCGESLFLFSFTDQIRQGIAETIRSLQEEHHMRLIMLTGDHYANARRVASEVGLKEFRAELTPEGKLHAISELAKSETLIMIGDGINDAPALARAQVGICMGKVGSTTAVEASDVVLLQDNIELIGWLLNKAHKTKAIVRQNLSLAIAAIFFAAFPALAGFVPLWLAVIMHEGGTVLVGLNALRLLIK